MSDQSLASNKPRGVAASRGVSVYLVYSALWMVALAVHYMRMRSGWVYGSWLINYQGGFIRRGLSGELLLRISHLLHMPLLPATALLQAACFATILLAIHRFANRTEQPLWAWAFLLSPATLAFPIFDSSFAFRQEILLIALVAAILILMQRVKNLPGLSAAEATHWLIGLAIALPFIVLCHEGLVFYFPYVAIAVYLGVRSVPVTTRLLAPAAVFSCVALALVVAHSGNAQTAHRVCESLGNPPEAVLTGLCSGSIESLEESLAHYRAQVHSLVHDRTAVLEYCVTIPLSFIPAALAFYDLRRRNCPVQKLRALFGAMLLSVAASVVLFTNATDWARWVYTHVMCLTLLLFWLNSDLPPSPTLRNRRPAGMKTWAARLALILYAVCWNLPYWPVRHVMGYAGVIGRYLHLGAPTTG